MSQEIKIHHRKSLSLFSNAMENKLRQNDWKGGWEQLSVSYLIKRLSDEVEELKSAIKTNDIKQISLESVDVANFAMMIFDNCSKILEVLEAKR